ncbi:MAG: ABC transporter permease [Rhodospirillales bacterium]|nr:ABC transporter permease [Rhodospirillales bacterium]
MESWRRSPKTFLALGLPPTAWLLLFFLIPIGIVWAFSFGEKVGIVDIDITGTFANYDRAFEAVYLQIMVKSLIMAGLTTLVCIAVGFPVAFLITFAPARWKPWLLLLIILPFWTNLLIRTYAMIAVLRTNNGFLNMGLEAIWDAADAVTGLFGLAALGAFQPWDILYSDAAVLIGMVYVFLPFAVLPLYSTLERLDTNFLEASLDLGAGHLKTFFSIVVPLAGPGIASAVIITFIPALGSFLQPDLLGGTDSQLIANVIERQFLSANDWPFGGALSFLLMYITFIAIAARAFLTRPNERRGSLPA